MLRTFLRCVVLGPYLVFTCRLLGDAPAAPAPAAPEEKKRDLTRLSLSELADLEVTSVSRRPEKLASAAAAVFVITSEDIRRLGITTLADALRLAPGVQVARINSNQWAVGVRGFASGLSRDLLVLVDGRSTYNPLFAGTYWDTLDTLLEDVDRIEVIRGPGGTLWGANAVNGVINIITKKATETTGGFAEAGGTGPHGFLGGRWGGSIGTDMTFRVYGKTFDRGAFFHPDGNDYDAWHMTQGGYSASWTPRPEDNVTFQGDVYSGKAGQLTTYALYEPPYNATVDFNASLSGGNALARWEHTVSPGSAIAVQAYFDRTLRTQASFSEVRNTFDVDLQYRLPLGGAHDLVFGAGFRHTTGDTASVPSIVFFPPDRTDDVYSAFLQDTWDLKRDRVKLIVGAKLEHNDYSGFEVQPNVRLLVTPNATQAIWASVSRAVRTPSRLESDLSVTVFAAPGPVYVRVVGDTGFQSEKTIAYELGYRIQPTPRIWFDAALFYNRYDDLVSLEPGAITTIPGVPGLVIPYREANGLAGHGYGGELAAEARVTDAWRVQATYSRLQLHIDPEPGSLDTTSKASTEGSSPRDQFTLRSSLDLPKRITFDAFFRAVSALPAQKVPGYATLDARVAWSPWPALEVAVVGRSLLQAYHVEFAGGPASAEVPRGVFGEVKVRW